MKKVKYINLILDKISLNKFKTIPTFQNMLHGQQLKELKIGDNNIAVNYYIYNKLLNYQGIGNFIIKSRES